MNKLSASAAMVALGWSTSVQAAPPPASAFGRVPAVLDVDISPNGQRVALMGAASEQRFISIATLDQPGLPILQLGDVEGVFLQWAGDEFVLARVAYWEKVGPRNVYRMERTISVTPQAKAVAQLFSADPVSSLLTEQSIVEISQSPIRAVALGLIESQGASSNMNTKLQRKGVDSPYVMALWSMDPATGRGRLLERGDYDTQAGRLIPAAKSAFVWRSTRSTIASPSAVGRRASPDGRSSGKARTLTAAARTTAIRRETRRSIWDWTTR